jgi:ammonia channel protein AmtB
MNDNMNMDSTIAGSMNDNINMDSTISGSMNDNIKIVPSILCCHLLTLLLYHPFYVVIYFCGLFGWK